MAGRRWGQWVVPALAAVLLMGWFSPEIYDSDFWWHLKTGQYIVEHHALPSPDPFAFTTAMRGAAYAGEQATRYFNLTHEWLAQALLYLVYAAAGYPGIVLARAFLLTAFCALVGLVVYRRCGGLYRAVAGAVAAASVVSGFAYDRPYLVTFVLLAATIAVLEFRRWMWLLPPLFLIWANCHGGYFVGWVVLAAYAGGEFRTLPKPRWRTLAPMVLALAISGLNPNGFRAPEILLYYRRSFLQSRLLEWAPPNLLQPGAFTILLFAALAVLIWARRRVRPVDWLLFAAFTAAAVTAQRNEFLMAVWAPVMIATYVPWKRAVPAAVPYAMAAVAAAGLIAGVASGPFFQLRAAEWKYPRGAADFLLAHHVTRPMFNTYEYGGYLIWRLWPRERVFIDGRALSEGVFMDYARILYNHDESGGKSAEQLLRDYGVDVIVMNTFEYSEGLVYLLAPALADPGQTEWKLVYSDPQAIVLMRRPPAGVAPLDSLGALSHMEAECGLHIEHEPRYPRCARALGQVFLKIGDTARARRWIGIYLSHPHPADAEAEDAYRRLLAAGQ